MTAVLILLALGIVSASAIVVLRPFKVSGGQKKRTTPVTPVATHPGTYFVRYLPNRTTGQGDAL